MSVTEASEAPSRTPVVRQIRLTPALAEDICTRIAKGETLTSIVKRKGMPSYAGVMKWLSETNPDRSARYPEFIERYRVARMHQAQAFFEQTIDISDNKGNKNVARDRLKVDARKWAASKLAPELYGDRVQHQHEVSGIVELVEHPRQAARAVLSLLEAGEAEFTDITPEPADEQG